jgi:hypothetical protein
MHSEAESTAISVWEPFETLLAAKTPPSEGIETEMHSGDGN